MLGKFAYLRGNFQRVLRKIRNTPSVSGGNPEPKWEYFKACSFLLPIYDNTSCESSLELQPQEEVVYEGTLEDLVQEDFSPLYSPVEIFTSPADTPCTSGSQNPLPQPVVDKPTGSSTPATSVASRGKKRKMEDSCDTSGKILQVLDTVNNTMNAFVQRKREEENETVKYDWILSNVRSFLNTFPIPDCLKVEFGSKMMLLMHEYMQHYNENEQK